MEIDEKLTAEDIRLTANVLLRKFEDIEKNNGWDALFKTLKRNESAWDTSVGRLEINRSLNRYRDVLPYDFALPKVPFYINASTVKMPLESLGSYVLSQGPLEATITDFWDMICRLGTKSIVMLNKPVENMIEKSAIYWPINAQEPLVFNKGELFFAVHLEEMVEYGNYVIRHLKVTVDDKSTSSVRECVIRQFHYVNWPDFCVPPVPKDFIEFWEKFADWEGYDSVNFPVIHCSAGIGRSGTFALLDAVLRMVISDREYRVDMRPDVEYTLIHLRGFRMGLVQTVEQFKFAYYAIIIGLKAYLKRKYPDNGFEENFFALPEYGKQTFRRNELESAVPPPPPRRVQSLWENRTLPEEPHQSEGHSSSRQDGVQTDELAYESEDLSDSDELEDVEGDSEAIRDPEISSVDSENDAVTPLSSDNEMVSAIDNVDPQKQNLSDDSDMEAGVPGVFVNQVPFSEGPKKQPVYNYCPKKRHIAMMKVKEELHNQLHAEYVVQQRQDALVRKTILFMIFMIIIISIYVKCINGQQQKHNN